jgi:hypothetical protein
MDGQTNIGTPMVDDEFRIKSLPIIGVSGGTAISSSALQEFCRMTGSESLQW